VASTVSTTAAANATMPPRGSMVASDPNWTTPARKATRNTSSIDQRPMKSSEAYSRVSPRRCGVDRRRTAISSHASPASFISGIRMLAMKTIAAIAHMPSCHRPRMPDMIVSVRASPPLFVLSTGSRLAGTSITAAASASADERERFAERR
jgi:hypothetical protein